MQYETLYANDNGTVKVRMTIDGNVLEQDFPAADLDTEVKRGMAVFKTELGRRATFSIVDTSLLGKVVSVDTLPTLDPADLTPESPVAPADTTEA